MSQSPSARAADAALDEYRITSPVEVGALLEKIRDARTLVTLSGPGGHSYTTLLLSVDAARGLICFGGETGHEGLRALLSSGLVEAAAYLDSIKVQFDVEGLAPAVAGPHEVLNARYPRTLYRFQRRAAFRVKPLLSTGPVALFPHPAAPTHDLSLRVLDISLTGVALLLPEDAPAIPERTRIADAQLRLDDETWVDVGLVVHHATPVSEVRGTRLGCEFTDLDRDGDRSLQHYINQTQKRQLALAARKD